MISTCATRTLRLTKWLIAASILLCGLLTHSVLAATVQNPQNGVIGVEGTIGAEAPKQPPTITLPTGGQSFSQVPITVRGLCQTDLLVRVFKNNVFAGSVVCVNGSYQLQIDLFSGRNDLVARQYDALEQSSPDSNTVAITFNDQAGTNQINRVVITSNYAKRGANPNEVLVWPFAISGGTSPYAVTIDWGDGSKTDLFAQQFPGEFSAKHTYTSPGIYNVIVRGSDKSGTTAYLQVVAIANGQAGTTKTSTTPTKTIVIYRIIWIPALILLIFMLLSFWLGQRQAIRRIRKSLELQDVPKSKQK